jgi:hypothetical protein
MPVGAVIDVPHIANDHAPKQSAENIRTGYYPFFFPPEQYNILLDPIDQQSLDEGQLFEFRLHAADPDNDSLIFSGRCMSSCTSLCRRMRTSANHNRGQRPKATGKNCVTKDDAE